MASHSLFYLFSFTTSYYLLGMALPTIVSSITGQENAPTDLPTGKSDERLFLLRWHLLVDEKLNQHCGFPFQKWLIYQYALCWCWEVSGMNFLKREAVILILHLLISLWKMKSFGSWHILKAAISYKIKWLRAGHSLVIMLRDVIQKEHL